MSAPLSGLVRLLRFCEHYGRHCLKKTAGHYQWGGHSCLPPGE